MFYSHYLLKNIVVLLLISLHFGSSFAMHNAHDTQLSPSYSNPFEDIEYCAQKLQLMAEDDFHISASSNDKNLTMLDQGIECYESFIQKVDDLNRRNEESSFYILNKADNIYRNLHTIMHTHLFNLSPTCASRFNKSENSPTSPLKSLLILLEKDHETLKKERKLIASEEFKRFSNRTAQGPKGYVPTCC